MNCNGSIIDWFLGLSTIKTGIKFRRLLKQQVDSFRLTVKFNHNPSLSPSENDRKRSMIGLGLSQGKLPWSGNVVISRPRVSFEGVTGNRKRKLESPVGLLFFKKGEICRALLRLLRCWDFKSKNDAQSDEGIQNAVPRPNGASHRIIGISGLQEHELMIKQKNVMKFGPFQKKRVTFVKNWNLKEFEWLELNFHLDKSEKGTNIIWPWCNRLQMELHRGHQNGVLVMWPDPFAK